LHCNHALLATSKAVLPSRAVLMDVVIRMSTNLRAALEREAQNQGRSLEKLILKICREWTLKEADRHRAEKAREAKDA
jgi:hypothetical protein